MAVQYTTRRLINCTRKVISGSEHGETATAKKITRNSYVPFVNSRHQCDVNPYKKRTSTSQTVAADTTSDTSSQMTALTTMNLSQQIFISTAISGKNPHSGTNFISPLADTATTMIRSVAADTLGSGTDHTYTLWGISKTTGNTLSGVYVSGKSTTKLNITHSSVSSSIAADANYQVK